MNRVAFKRIPKEVEKVSDLSGLGIYYVSDSASFLNGHAMIFGPEGTPYAHCPLFFNFQFPQDYPFSPPKVTFLTTDGRTRFHPNLYVNGKVCLSILGTYSGPSWQSTMSLSMILISLHALLDENPLRNEPGFEKLTLTDKRAKEYRELVQFRIALHSLDEYKKRHWISLFEEEAVVNETYKKLQNLIQLKGRDDPIRHMDVIYGMSGLIDWKLLNPDSNGG